MRYATLILPVCLSLTLFVGCEFTLLGTENYDASGEEKVESPPDSISGIYEMSGTRVITNICVWTCTPETQFERDTVQVTFDIEIRLIMTYEDSAYIQSLEENEPGPVGSLPDKNDGRIYLSNTQISYDFYDTGFTHSGEGEISGGRVTLSTYAHYNRGYTVENELTGVFKEKLYPEWH